MILKQKPSIGFWLLVAIYAAVAVFFIWAFSTPRLDEVWLLEQGLKTGQKQHLSNSEKELMYDVFSDYADYAKDLSGRRGIDLISANSDGRSLANELLILRTEMANGCGNFVLDVSGEGSEFPLIFTVKGRTWDKKLTFPESGRLVVELPKGVQVPEFIEVKRKNNKGKIGSVDVKVRFCE